MAELRIEVPEDVMPWLHALAVVRCCSVHDLIRSALTHLRVTQTEKQRAAFYRHLQATGSDRLDVTYTGQRHKSWDRA